MKGDEVFARPLVALDAEGDEEADAALVGSLHLAVRRAFDRREGCWPGRDPYDTLRRTCHAAEALHRLPLDAQTARVVREAASWLINLRLPPHLDRFERARNRLYPSRFKTLAYLDRFDDAVVRGDFMELLDTEQGGIVHGAGESDLLTTCIVLETLLTLEQRGTRGEVCGDRRYAAICNALRRHLGHWTPAAAQSESATHIGDEGWTASAAPARAPRGSGPLSKIEDARTLSYVWGLLHHAGRGRLTQRQLAAAEAELVRASRRTGSGRPGEIIQALYAALQIAEHRPADRQAREAVRSLLREVRALYARGEVTRQWGIHHHTLVMRLLVMHHGEAVLSRGIAAAFLRETERKRAEEDDSLRRELRDVIRERVRVELGAVEALAGGYTEAEVYRVPFRYWYPVPGRGGAADPLDATHTASVIVKRSTRDAFVAATENYRALPERLRGYFVRQPEEGQVHKAGDASTYYLAMEDLAEYLPLAALLERYDDRYLSDESRWRIEAMVQRVCEVSFAIFRETLTPRSSVPGSHVARLYLAPVEGKLLRAVQNVPWLKSALHELHVGDQRYRELDYYLGVVARHATALQPRALGLTHGDLHSGNVMLDPDLRRVKLIDLDKLSRAGDYLADLGNLLADVCVYRRVAQPEAHFGLAGEDVVFPTERGEAGTAENAVRYPALGRPATVAFQRRLLEEVAGFAGAEDVRDTGWRARLWLATATALLVRLAFEKQRERAAVLYAEGVRLLGELVRHMEHGAPLPAVLVPETWPQPAPARPAGELPEWTLRYPVLRAVHERLRQLALHAIADRATVTYLVAGDRGTPLAKLVPAGREGIGRLLLPTGTQVNGNRGALKVVTSRQEGDALGTIVIIEPTTSPDAVATLVRSCLAGVRG